MRSCHERKNRKEKLTKDNIKRDLTEQLKPMPIVVEILLHLVIIAFIALVVYRLSTEEMSKQQLYFSIVLFALLTVAYLAVIVYFIFLRRKINKQRKMVQNGEFEIVRDTLTVAGTVARYKGGAHEKLDLWTFFIDKRYGRRYENPIWFQFAKYGDYHLPLTKMYKWSERYAMSDEGVQNTSLIGDEFYIVLYHGDQKKKPVMIYNTKLFDYMEEESW